MTSGICTTNNRFKRSEKKVCFSENFYWQTKNIHNFFGDNTRFTPGIEAWSKENLRFHSFSLIVKLPEFVRVYSTNILRCCNVKLAQSTEVRSFFSSSWVHARSGFLCYDVCVAHVVCILSSKTNIFGKDSHPKLPVWINSCFCWQEYDSVPRIVAQCWNKEII